jgi:DNA invertase Pin-like site-specific DNA recombinase
MSSKSRYNCLIVGYRRTSTDDQRLGIEAQDATMQRIASERHCRLERVYTEHESGGDDDRPELAKALKHAKRIGAILAVAKLDRLARNSTFLMKVYDGGVPVLFGDLPEVDGSAASRLMVQMMANIAEFERRRIGERTRDALALLKARGVKLGTPENLTREAQLKGARASATASLQRAVEDMSDVAPIAARMKAEGHTLRSIAEHLDGEGYVTRQGKSWSATQVMRVLNRAASTN